MTALLRLVTLDMQPRCMWTIRMNDDNNLRTRRAVMGQIRGKHSLQREGVSTRGAGQAEEMRSFAEALDHSWDKKLQAVKEQRLLKFDSRTLIAMGALALSLVAYVIQDARNTARQDSEIEATKARVMRLEQIAATNTEARIRTEVQLGELRDGQDEIKALIQAHDSGSRTAGARSRFVFGRSLVVGHFLGGSGFFVRIGFTEESWIF